MQIGEISTDCSRFLPSVSADYRGSQLAYSFLVLVAVVNYGEAAKAAVKIDGEKLSIGESNTWKVTDAEEGTAARSKRDPATGEQIPGWKAEDEAPISHDGKGTLTVPVKRHSYRLVTITGDGSK